MSHFKERLQLFKNRSFSWYLASCSLAMFGNGLTYIAMTWTLLKGHHNITAISVLMACFWLPNILLSPFLGVIVDKYPRKQLLLLCFIGRGLILLIFWLLTLHTLSNQAIYLLSFLSGSILSVIIPSSLTLIREVVPQDKLLYANATVDTAYELGAIIGMGSSGLIIALVGINNTFLINGLCFLCASLGLWQVKVHHPSASQLNEAFFESLKSGMQYLLARRNLVIIYSIQMLFFVCYMTAPILLAPYAKQILHTNALQFGSIEAAMSVGAVIGGILSPYFCEKFGFKRIAAFEALLCGISFFMFSHNHILLKAILWYFFIGFSFSCWPLLITHAQDLTDIEYQGRVQSLFNSVSGILILFFYLILGQFGEFFSLSLLYWLEIIFMALGLVLLYTLKEQIFAND